MESSRQLLIGGALTAQASFNYYMSYAELSNALYLIQLEGRLLSKTELHCLELSLQDPFLQKMLALYPLTKKSQKLVTDSLEYQRAIQAPETPVEIDTNVHSAIYGGEREKVAHYLKKNYPSASHQNVIDKIDAFLGEILQRQDAQYELSIGEADRYAKRQKEYAAGHLSSLTPLQSFEQIESDFMEYCQHLRRLHQEGCSYSWDVLSSIFQRLETVPGQHRQESEFLLLRALDDSRTAYHDKPNTFVPGKDYTCPQGLEERLLDHHALIFPAERVSRGPDLLEQTILALTEPFILRDPEQRRPLCSQEVYQLYLNAAGYRVEEREEFYFELKEQIDIAHIKKEYLATMSENKLERIRAENNFNAFMRIIDDTPCSDLGLTDLVSFLSERDLLMRVLKTRTYTVLPENRLTSDEIMKRMLEQGPFIDRAHLEMILAIYSEKISLDVMEDAALSGTAGHGVKFQQSRQEMRQRYLDYITCQMVPFYHFMEEAKIEEKISAHHFQTIGLSQEVICQWWVEHHAEVWEDEANRLAFLCAKAGYASAMRVFCQFQSINPNYLDEQENETLLGVAIANGHTHVVRVLLEAGANANLNTHNESTPLIIAASHGYLEIVSLLIAAGADVNLQNGHRWSPLMAPAMRGYTDIVRLLIDAGADCNLQRRHRQKTALSDAVESGHADIIRLLIEAGACATQQNMSGAALLMNESLAHRKKFLADLESGDIEAIGSSIAAGANINRLSDGRSGLDCAVHQRDPELVKVFLESKRLAPWVIIKAFKNCVENSEYHEEILPLLLTQTSIVQLIVRNGYQKQPLTWAVDHQCLAALQAFIAVGAPPEERNTQGETALMLAQRLGLADYIEVLSPQDISQQNDTILAQELRGAPFVLSLTQGAETVQTDSHLRKI